MKRQLDVLLQQKYNYLSPFKYCADEFRRRLVHVNQRLSEQGKKHNEMVKRFNQNMTSSHKMEWYYSDEIGPNGGYYITSTIYMNCMLFYWMKRIQWENPYIPLSLSDDSDDLIKEYESNLKSVDYIVSINKKGDVYDFIKNTKIAISGANGIPYGLHDSLGDSMFNHNENRLINYEEFCMLLNDNKNRIKFMPVIKFWQNIGLSKDSIFKAKMNKIRVLIMVLKLLDNSDIREE